MGSVAVIVLVLAAMSLAGAADSWDPHVMFVKSVKECHDKFPDLEIGKLREYILKKDPRIKCFLDCLIRSNGLLDESNKVKEEEVHKWMAAAAEALNAIGINVNLDQWKQSTQQCAKEEYPDGDEKCSGAVKVFMCYVKGFPMGE